MHWLTQCCAELEEIKRRLCNRVCCEGFHQADIIVIPVRKNFIWIIGSHEVIRSSKIHYSRRGSKFIPRNKNLIYYRINNGTFARKPAVSIKITTQF